MDTPRTVLEVLKIFLRADLEERNLDKALSCLSREICWYGAGETEDVRGQAEAERYMRREFAASNTAYRLEFLEEQGRTLAAGAETVLLKCRVSGGGLQINCRVSAAGCQEDGALKLCSLHMSVPDVQQKSSEYFPFSLEKYYEQALYREFLDRVIDGGIVGCYDAPGYPFYLVNRQLLDFLGFPSEAVFCSELEGAMENLIDSADRSRVIGEIRRQLAERNRYCVEYRMRRRDGACVWVEDHGKLVDTPDGRSAIISIINDISLRKSAQTRAAARDEELRNLYNTIPGGVCTCKHNALLEVVFANRGFYDFLGYTKERFSAGFHNSFFRVVDERDKDLLRETLNAQLSKGKYVECTHRIVCGDGAVKWLCIHAVLSGGGQEELLYCTFVDITAQKNAEQLLRENEQRTRLAIEGAGLNVWEYDIPNRRILSSTQSSTPYGFPAVLDRVPESIIAYAGMTLEQSQDLRELYRRVEAGEPRCSADFWFTDPQTDRRWCERVSYSTVLDGGRPVKAYGVGMDVTASKLAEKRYREEIAYCESVSETTAATCCVNLTTGMVEALRVGAQRGLEETCRHVMDFRTRLQTHFHAVALSEEQNQHFSPEALIRNFNRGITTLSAEYQAQPDERHHCWMHTDVNLIKSPGKGDILAFFYHRDRTEELIRQSVMNTLMMSAYDEVGTLDLRTGLCRKITGPADRFSDNEEFDYTERLNELCAHWVAPEDRDRVHAALQIAQIETELETADHCDLRYTAVNRRGRRSNVLLRYQMLWKEGEVLLITRQCIDELMKKEQEKQRQLEQIAQAAAQANRAKSKFLSNMSHDMRTPMNAIIGISGLGEHCGSTRESQEYHKEIHEAGEYLLGLINDVLEMSRIESGKTRLNLAPLRCEAFVESLSSMLNIRAASKSVTLSFAGSKPGTYAAILMDIRMPVMDGLTAARSIRGLDRPDAGTIPIIAMTANADQEDMERSGAAGMNAHLAKPIDPDQLYDTLERFCRTDD